jgi:hypothetical protein
MFPFVVNFPFLRIEHLVDPNKARRMPLWKIKGLADFYEKREASSAEKTSNRVAK